MKMGGSMLTLALCNTKSTGTFFGLGDVCNLPTAKTAAAIFSQTPVVVNNLLVEMGQKQRIGTYNGYSSCPLFVGDSKLMMIEFKYGGVADETFFSD